MKIYRKKETLKALAPDRGLAADALGAWLGKATEVLDVDFFICGHQPQETGYDVLHDRMIILASDHNHGVFLPLDLSKPVTIESLTRNIRPFASVP